MPVTIPSVSDAVPHWIYDGSDIADPHSRGERAVQFLRALRHAKSHLPKRAFQLDPWAERVVHRIYGPRHDNDTRIVDTVALMLPRDNRKTFLAAARALLHTIGPERMPGGEAIFAADDRKQAGIGVREAAGIIREDKNLIAWLRPSSCMMRTMTRKSCCSRAMPHTSRFSLARADQR